MSVINKMLQDLDARGGPGAPAQPSIRLVVRQERRPAPLMLAGAALAIVALAAAGYFGWRALHPARVVVVAAPASVAPVKTVLLAPLPAVVAVSPPVVAPVAPAPVPVPPPMPAAMRVPASVARMPVLAPIAAGPVAAPVAPESVARAAPHAPLQQPRADKPPVAAAQKADPVPQPVAVPLTASQRGETGYRRALAALQEGRSGEAIAGLEQVLQIDPHHDPARQTLVGLLVENKRPDDAMRQLQLALGADPRQPAMAMLLARLQIERGGSGVDTLLRTLPYAAGDAGYHAFLAGALQRQQRHREAAEQYQAALRAEPQHGVWLMGLGISLQAEKRDAEARAAYQKARASAGLSPELQAFIDRKLLQLSQ